MPGMTCLISVFILSFLSFYVQPSSLEILHDWAQWTQRLGVVTNRALGVNVCFELGGETLGNEGLHSLYITTSNLPSLYPLTFPWRSIKRQPLEREHWFLGICGDKMHTSTHSPLNYPIWGPLIWTGHAGTVNRAVGGGGVEQWRGTSLLKTHRDGTQTGTDGVKRGPHKDSECLWALLQSVWKENMNSSTQKMSEQEGSGCLMSFIPIQPHVRHWLSLNCLLNSIQTTQLLCKDLCRLPWKITVTCRMRICRLCCKYALHLAFVSNFYTKKAALFHNLIKMYLRKRCFFRICTPLVINEASSWPLHFIMIYESLILMQ